MKIPASVIKERIYGQNEIDLYNGKPLVLVDMIASGQRVSYIFKYDDRYYMVTEKTGETWGEELEAIPVQQKEVIKYTWEEVEDTRNKEGN